MTLKLFAFSETSYLRNCEAPQLEFAPGHFAIMSSKHPPSNAGAKPSPNPVFGKQSSKAIFEEVSGSSAKSPYAVARPQPAAAARAGSHGELLMRADPAI
jgi:hypothetical protein